MIINASIKAKRHESFSKRQMFVKVKRLSCWTSCHHWDLGHSAHQCWFIYFLFCISWCECYMSLLSHNSILSPKPWASNAISLPLNYQKKKIFWCRLRWNGGGSVFWVMKAALLAKAICIHALLNQTSVCLCFWLWCQESWSKMEEEIIKKLGE